MAIKNIKKASGGGGGLSEPLTLEQLLTVDELGVTVAGVDSDLLLDPPGTGNTRIVSGNLRLAEAAYIQSRDGVGAVVSHIRLTQGPSRTYFSVGIRIENGQSLRKEDDSIVFLFPGTTGFEVRQAISPQAVGNIGLIVQGLASQTADLQRWQDSAAAVLAAIDAQGDLGIGGAPANASAGIEILGTTKALLVSRLTTAQRDALTAVDGMIIYNTTTATLQGRVAAAWVNL